MKPGPALSFALTVGMLLFATVTPETRSQFSPNPPRPRVVRYPACQYCPAPDYTKEAYKAKIRGSIQLKVTITPEGRADNISVLKGLGYGLDEKAIEAVQNWRFSPAENSSGEKVAYPEAIDINFVPTLPPREKRR